MDAAALLQAWRRILPPAVSVCAGPIESSPPPLTEGERHSAGDVDPVRLRELENGRAAAKRALSALGVSGVELPVGENRAPRWPVGIVGSITHAGNMVAAAVARTSDLAAIGIDVEADRPTDPRVWELMMSAGERRRLLDLPPSARADEAQLLWGIKEATLKAAHRKIDPLEIDLQREAPTSDGVTWWRIPLGGGTWRGGTLRWEGWVLAAVTRDAN
jgi:hypothetical protein